MVVSAICVDLRARVVVLCAWIGTSRSARVCIGVLSRWRAFFVCGDCPSASVVCRRVLQARGGFSCFVGFSCLAMVVNKLLNSAGLVVRWKDDND